MSANDPPAEDEPAADEVAASLVDPLWDDYRRDEADFSGLLDIISGKGSG